MYACISMEDYIGGSGGMKFLEIRSPEIASEAILGRKQSRIT